MKPLANKPFSQAIPLFVVVLLSCSLYASFSHAESLENELKAQSNNGETSFLETYSAYERVVNDFDKILATDSLSSTQKKIKLTRVLNEFAIPEIKNQTSDSPNLGKFFLDEAQQLKTQIELAHFSDVQSRVQFIKKWVLFSNSSWGL